MGNDNKEALGQLAQRLFNDALHNILHDIVINRHREHKQLLATLDPLDRLPHCDTCNLPRLVDPPLALKVREATSEPPASTTYCDRKPWSTRAGYDIYDNPFPRGDATGRPPTKKEREAAKNSKKDDAADDGANGDGSRGSPPSPNIDGNEQSAATAKLEKGEKKASKIDEKLKKGEYVPWHTCPNCKRSLLITRFAKHLEQCMNISGRAAARNAMAKMNGSTPGGSRNGTPAPASQSQDSGKDADDDEDDVDVKAPKNVRKQLLKKGLDKRLKDQKKLATNGKLSRVSSISGKRSSPARSASDGKRDRDELSNGGEDEDGEEVHVKKRQKMSRVNSQASIESSTVNGAGADMERAESQDGSFVDDGGSVIDD